MSITSALSGLLTKKAQQDQDAEQAYSELVERAVQGKNAKVADIERILRQVGKSPHDLLTDVSVVTETKRLQALAANQETLEKAQREAYRLIQNLKQERGNKISEVTAAISLDYAKKIDTATKEHAKLRAEFQESVAAKETLGIAQKERDEIKARKKEELQALAATKDETYQELIKVQHELRSKRKGKELSDARRAELKKAESELHQQHIEASRASEELSKWI